MIRLRPVQTEQTFSIIPASFVGDELDDMSVSLINKETNVSDDSLSFTWNNSHNNNFIEISLTPSVTFKEDQIYRFLFKSSTEVYYRDLIYITSETEKKKSFKYPEIYNQRNDGNDEYIVL